MIALTLTSESKIDVTGSIFWLNFVIHKEVADENAFFDITPGHVYETTY